MNAQDPAAVAAKYLLDLAYPSEDSYARVIRVNYRPLLEQIIEEANSPVCVSYEYDPTPTAEQRLAKIAAIDRAALNPNPTKPESSK